ncbi:MAG TPA: sterol desaturase family protein [Myxococcales bacterium]|nr:sterol desaturase [Myxococcales bacterium]HAN30566.1 sterol desaturase family protein [Myxococcales bacterium]
MTELYEGLRRLSEPLFDPGHRIYWPFLVGSLLIAGFAAAIKGRRRLVGLLSPELWLHRSARVDYQLWLVKHGAKLAGLLVLPLSTLTVARWTVRSLSNHFDLVSAPNWPSWLISALFTGALFVCWDLSRYLLHRLMHSIPSLWSLHQVHHSAEVLTPMTFYRTHPLESLLYQLRGVLVAGVLTGVFFWLFQTRAQAWQLLGVSGVGFAFNLLGGNLRHSHVWLSYGRVEKWLLSPAQHQLHHAEGCVHNYGAWLALWDRIGGSLMLAGTERQLTFGLPEQDRNHQPDSLWSILWRPVLDALRLLNPLRTTASADTRAQ